MKTSNLPGTSWCSPSPGFSRPPLSAFSEGGWEGGVESHKHDLEIDILIFLSFLTTI